MQALLLFARNARQDEGGDDGKFAAYAASSHQDNAQDDREEEKVKFGTRVDYMQERRTEERDSARLVDASDRAMCAPSDLY